jgi:hypothetical protein
MKIPGSVRLRKFLVNGINMRIFVREIKIFESLMRPFQTAEVLIIDSQNIINENKWNGGESVELSFDAGEGEIYSTKLKVLSVADIKNFPSLRAQSYIFNLVGESFFNNKLSKVQMTFQNISGARAIEKLHNTYLHPSDASLSIVDSKGFIAEAAPYIISNQYPFEAITDIRGRLTHSTYKSGAFAYYRDKDSYNLCPIEKMFKEMKVNFSFEQNSTIGKDFTDIMRQYKNIIGFKLGTSFNPAGKNSSAEMQRVGKNVITNIVNVAENYSKGQMRNPLDSINSQGGFASDSSSLPYARAIRNIINDYKINKISPIAEKIDSEQLYGKMIQDGTACTISVLIEGGLYCTVGKGVYAGISAPVGMSNQSGANQLKGNYLVVNLCHHLKLFDIAPQGVTTMEIAKGDLSV